MRWFLYLRRHLIVRWHRHNSANFSRVLLKAFLSEDNCIARQTPLGQTSRSLLYSPTISVFHCYTERSQHEFYFHSTENALNFNPYSLRCTWWSMKNKYFSLCLAFIPDGREERDGGPPAPRFILGWDGWSRNDSRHIYAFYSDV